MNDGRNGGPWGVVVALLFAAFAVPFAAPGVAQQLEIQSGGSEFSASPEADYYVSGWTGLCNPDPVVNPNAANVSVTVGDPVAEGGGVPKTCALNPAPETAGDVAAAFARVPTRAVNFPQPSSGGTLAAVAVVPADPAPAEITLASGDAVSVHLAVRFAAEPAPGHFVEEWTGDCDGAPTGENDPSGGVAKHCELPPSLADAFVTVAFALVPRVVRFSKNAGGELLVTVAETAVASGGKVPSDLPVTFSAVPLTTHYVSEWTGDCDGADDGKSDSAGGSPKECVVPAGQSAVDVTVAFAPVANCAEDNRELESVAQCGGCAGAFYWDGTVCTTVVFNADTFRADCTAAGGNATYPAPSHGPVVQYIRGVEREVGQVCYEIGGDASDNCFLVTHPDFDRDTNAYNKDDNQYIPGDSLFGNLCHEEFPVSAHVCDGTSMVDHDDNPFTACEPPSP